MPTILLNETQRTERNALICRLYQEGLSQAAISQRIHISRERVRQILNEAGIMRRPQQRSKNGRQLFLGVLVTKDVKVALQREAEKRGLSMSELTSTMLGELLDACEQQDAK